MITKPETLKHFCQWMRKRGIRATSYDELEIPIFDYNLLHYGEAGTLDGIFFSDRNDILRMIEWVANKKQ